MTRALRAFYTFVALRWFRLTGALWILYFLHVGWALWQVGVAEAAYHAVSFASDVPTGAFADRMGRRTSVATGLVLAAVTDIALYLIAPGHVFLGTLVMAITALSWTFIGGADAALLHNLAAVLPGGTGTYARLYGRMDALGLLSGAVAAVLGGWLAVSRGWLWPYAGEALAMLLAVPFVLSLPAGRSGGAVGPRPGSLVRQVIETLGEVRKRPAVLVLVLFGAVLGVVATSNHLYAQSSLVRKGLSTFGATAVIGLGDLAAAVSSAASHRLVRRMRALLILSVLLAVSISGVGGLPGLLAVAAYGVSSVANGATDVLFVTELNDHAPEEFRAGILSVPSSLFSLGMMVAFPVEGLLMARVGLGPVYTGLALLLIVVLAAVFGPGRGTRWT
jgi:MFS family permease